MGFLLNAIAKSYGTVLEGDYKNAKIGARYVTDNYFYIMQGGKTVEITKDDISSFEIQNVNAFGVSNVKILFKDGKKSLIQFTREGMDVFNRTTF